MTNLLANTARRLKIGVIGDNLSALSMAKAWASAGHQVIGLSVESESAQERADSLLPGVPLMTLAAVADQAELIVLGVPAASIEPTVTGLAELGFLGPKKILLHTAPEFGYSVLASAARLGSIPIAMSPLINFSGTSSDQAALRQSVIVITAPEVLMPIAEALAIELGGDPVQILEFQRVAYFEAIDVATKFSTLVVQQALGILREAGVERASELLEPVLRAAIEAALSRGFQNPNPEDVI